MATSNVLGLARRRGALLAVLCGAAIAPSSALLAGAAIAPPSAAAAISLVSTTDTVTTSRLTFGFGAPGGNVERLDTIRWRDSAGTLGPNLADDSGTMCHAGDPSDSWGRAGSTAGAPQPVGDGSTGTWTPRAQRTVEIASSRDTMCTGEPAATPVRTRYTFFDVGGAASKVRVERRISFSAMTPAYATTSMRAYVPELPLAPYSEVLHPNAAGTALVHDASHDPAEAETNWNGVWLALNDPGSGAGMVILRETTANPAQLQLESNTVADSSSVDLLRPASGWKAPVTETEWLCFYDATSWPPAQRTATTLPSQCSVVPVPIDDSPPSVAGTARVTNTLTASPGGWDYTTGGFGYQWLRCAAGACASIAGATKASYTATDADVGQQLRVDVTATAAGGESDTASAITDAVKPGPPTSTAPPTVSGTPRARETLTGTPGSWTGSPGSFQYQWLRCATATGTSCSDVAGATGTTYLLGPADVGSTMRLRVHAVNAQGTSAPADSAATAPVQQEVIAARLEISQPDCTGVPVRFDSSGSTTPNGPIVRYQLTFRQPAAGAIVGALLADAFTSSDGTTPEFDALLARTPVKTLSDSSSAVTDMTFTWNRQIPFNDSENRHRGGYAADPMFVYLTVTDRAGAQASTEADLAFAQTYSTDPRADCPKQHALSFVAFKQARDAGVFAHAFRATLRCDSSVPCAGSVQVIPRPRHRRHRVGHALVLAQSALFDIPAHASEPISAPLTAAGRRTLRRGRRVPVTILTTSVTPGGQAVIRSVSATLRAHH